jgi:uncharacterized protein YecE (DUF72 family)
MDWLKVPQNITREKVLLNCQHEMDPLLSAVRLLEDKLLCCLLQFPYFNKSAFVMRDAFTAIPELPAGADYAGVSRDSTGCSGSVWTGHVFQ